jgi:hypothetical protein
MKLNLYKNTGKSINSFLRPLSVSSDYHLINQVLNQNYFDVELTKEFIILPISSIQKKAIIINIDKYSIVTEFYLEDEHD